MNKTGNLLSGTCAPKSEITRLDNYLLDSSTHPQEHLGIHPQLGRGNEVAEKEPAVVPLMVDGSNFSARLHRASTSNDL